MILDATVIDSSTGRPLPGATIAIDGRPITVSDNLGIFHIDGPDGMNVTASYVGYAPNTLPVGVVQDDAQIRLDPVPQTLPVVSVVAKVKQNPAPFVLGAGALGLLLFANSKKRKMGKIDTTTILLIGGAALAVYLLTRRTQAAQTLPVAFSPSPQTFAPYAPGGSTTAQDITAGGQAASSILDAISNL